MEAGGLTEKTHKEPSMEQVLTFSFLILGTILVVAWKVREASERPVRIRKDH